MTKDPTPDVPPEGAQLQEPTVAPAAASDAPPRKERTKKGQTEITVYPDWCKGCGICVAFCPGKVLELNELGKCHVVRVEECVNCGFCERHCPDFAITVRLKGRRKTSAMTENGS